MSMKTCLKKQVSVLLCFFLLISILTPFPIHGEDDVPTATLSPTYLIKSDQAQTVTMNVRLPATTQCKKFSCNIITDDDIEIVSISEELTGSGTEISGSISTDDVSAEYTNMCTVTYRVPANTEGTFTLGVEAVWLLNAENKYYLENGEALVTLTVYNRAADAPAQGKHIHNAQRVFGMAALSVILHGNHPLHDHVHARFLAHFLDDIAAH